MRTETKLEKVERLIEQARLRRERERRMDIALMPVGVALVAAVVWWVAHNMTLIWVAAMWSFVFVAFAVRLALFLTGALATVIAAAQRCLEPPAP